MPGEVRAFLQTSLDDVVLQEGFGCDASILQDLWRACQERQRVRIVHDRGHWAARVGDRPLSNIFQAPGAVP